MVTIVESQSPVLEQPDQHSSEAPAGQRDQPLESGEALSQQDADNASEPGGGVLRSPARSANMTMT